MLSEAALTHKISRHEGERGGVRVADYYTETLKQSPEAMKYLSSRGLTSPEMIDRFKLGFANRTLGLRLPAKNRAAGAEMRGRLQQLGGWPIHRGVCDEWDRGC